MTIEDASDVRGGPSRVATTVHSDGTPATFGIALSGGGVRASSKSHR